jgi:hypothetical protein
MLYEVVRSLLLSLTTADNDKDGTSATLPVSMHRWVKCVAEPVPEEVES